MDLAGEMTDIEEFDGPYDVFISYAREDAAAAERLAKLLQDQHRTVWWDRLMKSGDNFKQEIPRQLWDAGAVVTLWSKHSARSSWVHDETVVAVFARKSVPLRIKHFDIARLDEPFRDLHTPGYEQTLADPASFLARLDELQRTRRGAMDTPVDITRLPPTYASRLFGREKEQADLLRAWQSSGSTKINIAALDAIGGAGKTALVSSFVKELARQGGLGAKAVFGWSFFSQGADVNRPGSAEPFFHAALKWFGHNGTPPATQHDQALLLAELITRQRTLLILDGLEPLQYPAGRSGGGLGAEGLAGGLIERGMATFLRQLAVRNPGLVIVTTRLPIPELREFEPATVSYPLERVPTGAGVELLRGLGVQGSPRELIAAVEELRGHALALSNMGRYLVTYYGGDARRRDTMPPLDGFEGRDERDPFVVMQAYEMLFLAQTRRKDDPVAARQLTLLYVLGLFDRPAPRRAVDAVLVAPIPGLTDHLGEVSPRQWSFALAALRKLGLISPSTSRDGDLDTHPLVREYFGIRLNQIHPHAWRAANELLWHYYESRIGDAADDGDAFAAAAAAVAHAARARRMDAALALYQRHIPRQVKAKGWYPLDITVLLSFFREPWRVLADGLDTSGESLVLSRTQEALRSTGRLPEAAEVLMQTCDMLQVKEIWPLYVNHRHKLVVLLIMMGRLGKAMDEATLALRAADEHNVPAQRADLLAALGHAHHMAGHLDDADKMFVLARHEAASKKDQRLASFRQFLMNEYDLDEGRSKLVKRRTWKMRQARQSADRASRHEGALDLLSFGRAHLVEADKADANRVKQYALAARPIESALAELRNINRLDELPRALILRARCRRGSGHFDQASQDLSEALHLAKLCEMPLFEVDACLEAVELQWESNRIVGTLTARQYLERAQELIRRTGYGRRTEFLAQLLAELPHRPNPPAGDQSPAIMQADPATADATAWDRIKRAFRRRPGR